MVRGKALLAVLLALFACQWVLPLPTRAAGNRHLLLEIQVQNQADVRALQQLNLDIAAQLSSNRVQVIASAEELRALQQAGWSVRVLQQNLITRFARDVNADGDLGSYHTYAEMVSELQQIAAAYPNITRLVDIGDSWEKTQGLADRDIWALKISDQPNADDVSEPDVLIMGCHHARELITVEIPLALAALLTQNYANGGILQALVNAREIWIVPMVNPDGHVYVETTDPMWRKNRNTNGYEAPILQGVDLNRNYGYMWGYDDVGSSPFPASESYRGSAAFSEPETRAIRDLVEAHNFTFSLSYHSYGDLFLFPWGYQPLDTPDDPVFNFLGRVYSLFNGYTYGNILDGLMYTTNGDTDDWMYGEQSSKDKVFGVTVEVGDEFQPPSSEVPTLVNENLAPALMMIYLAGYLVP